MSNKQLQNIPYFAAVLFLTAILVKPAILIAIATFYHYIAFKCLVAILVVSKRGLIIKAIKRIKPNRKSNLLFGIELHDLIDYLVEFKSFRQVHVKNHFGLAHNKMVKLGKHLESRGVLGRGECNAFVLNEVTRSEIVSLLKEKGNRVSPLKIIDWRAPRVDFNMNVKAI